MGRFSYIPVKGTLAFLTEGGSRWLVSYPTGRKVERDAATARSFGITWPDGTELRTRGVRFVRILSEEGLVLQAYDRDDGTLFVTYTRIPAVPADWPVQPCSWEDAARPATCGGCGLTWDDSIVTSMTPAPSARCPFEPFHHEEV